MKKEASNKLEQLIQSKFENLEISPNPEVWNRIEAAIDENQKVAPIIPFGWSKVILLTAVIAGSFVTGYFVSNYKTENNTISNSNSSSLNLKNEKVLQINHPSINISKQGNTIGSDKISTEKITATNTNQSLNKKIGNSNGILSSNVSKESKSNINAASGNKTLEQQDIIPAFEPKLNSKKAKNRKPNIAPLATAPSNDKATNTGISATTIYKESTSKIYVKRNNEMIALEIVGDGQVNTKGMYAPSDLCGARYNPRGSTYGE